MDMDFLQNIKFQKKKQKFHSIFHENTILITNDKKISC